MIDKFYHYTSKSSALNILKTNTLWFSYRDDLDDETNQIEKRRRALKKDFAKASPILDCLTTAFDETYIFCACKNPNNNYLWRNFAKDSGVCLEIAVSQEILDMRGSQLAIYDIRYQTVRHWIKENLYKARIATNKFESDYPSDYFLQSTIDLNDPETYPNDLIDKMVPLYISLLESKDHEKGDKKFLHENELRFSWSPLLNPILGFEEFLDTGKKLRRSLALPSESFTSVFINENSRMSKNSFLTQNL